jgi:RNA polymerase sigma-70 factor, ECF subfamily
MAPSSQSVDRLEALILPHLDDAYTLARYLLRDEHDAQDAVQDAALRAVRYADGFRDGDSRAWFLVIVRNCCLTRRRRQQNEPPMISLLDDAAPLSDSSAADARAIERSDRELLARAVSTLPVEFQEVIVLREIQQLSYSEISDVVGAPIGTVMSRLSRARKRLAAALGRTSQEAG